MMPTSRHIPTVLIADDHPIFRQGARDIIENDGRWRVVAEAANGDEALEKYHQYHPDVLILDISMGRTSGLDVAARVLADNPAAQCVMMTMYHDDIFRQQALKLGVVGYLLKENASEDLLNCLANASKAAGIALQSPPETPPDAADTLALLTQKEQQVLTAVAALQTNSQIAESLGISIRTVENHRSNIAKKLKLRGRNALLHFALAHFQG